MTLEDFDYDLDKKLRAAQATLVVLDYWSIFANYLHSFRWKMLLTGSNDQNWDPGREARMGCAALTEDNFTEVLISKGWRTL